MCLTSGGASALHLPVPQRQPESSSECVMLWRSLVKVIGIAQTTMKNYKNTKVLGIGWCIHFAPSQPSKATRIWSLVSDILTKLK
jgi:hypothetical protein